MTITARWGLGVVLVVLGACGGDDGGPDDGGAGPDGAMADGAVPDGGARDGGGTDGGSGPSIPIVPGYAAGGRLEVVAAGSDGSPGLLLHFRDTELDVPCGFSVAADGVTRCLPLNRTPINAPWYADSACTEVRRTGGVPDCAPLPWAYTQGEPVDACRTAVTNPVVRLEAIDAPTEVWSDESGACTGPVAPDPVPPHVFRETGPWPADEFVAAATERTQAIDDRLSVRSLVTAEGAGQVLGLVDAMHGHCYPRPTPSDGTRCIPERSLPTGPAAQYFLDAACTAEPAVPGRSTTALPGCDRTDPVLATWFEIGDEGVRFRVHRLGAAVTGTVYRASDCGAVDTATLDMAVYPLEEEITSEMVALTETTIGDRPVQARFWATEAGPALPMWKLHDPARSLPCDPVQLDGSLRCVPSLSSGSQILYADAACTDPVHHDYVGYADALEVVFLGEGVECDPASLQVGREPWQVGALYEGTLYGPGDGSCAEVERVADAEYRRITPLDPSTLPALSR